jgi:transposase
MAGGPGRPSKGPKLVRRLDGSAHARKRLEMVLETVAGGMSVGEACERLGIGGTAFHKMRTKALGAALVSLEPKALGRPPRQVDEKDHRIAELGSEIDRLKKEVATSHVREELALAMPFLADNRKWREQFEKPGGKKGRERKRNLCRSATDQSAGSAALAPAQSGEPQGAQKGRQDEGRDGGKSADEAP